MLRQFFLGLLCVLTAITLATGCKPKAPIQTATSSGCLQTPFQSESQFIVEAIVSDLAEQIYYATTHRLPEKKYFSVIATEKPGSPPDAPVYDLQINLDEKHAGLKLDVNVNGPIWSPGVYHDLAAALARIVGLNAGATNKTGDTTLLSKLLDGTPETIERENQTLSEALEKDFTNQELLEQAALLLGAFLLREHSGKFFEIRSPLSRITAHLTMARFLSGADSYGVNGRLAEATLLTLVNDEAPALEQLKSMDTNNTAVASMVRTLQTRNAVQQNFYFMNAQWGVPDDAKEFAAKCEREFGGRRLYPFVRRFNCTDVEAYHKSVDDGFKVTVDTPHLVPAECWNNLCYRVSFAPLYSPNPNPHINEWHSHNPPPGTVSDLHPRLNHPSLVGRPEAIARFEQLHELAPYDCRIANYIVRNKYKNNSTHEQAPGLYNNLLPYSVFALQTVTNTVYDQPDQYEKFMLQAATPFLSLSAKSVDAFFMNARAFFSRKPSRGNFPSAGLIAPRVGLIMAR